MSMTATIELGSAHDRGTFLVPAYGFGSLVQSENYAQSARFRAENKIHDFDDVFAPVVLHDKAYVARESVRDGTWSADSMMHSPRIIGGKPVWHTLRESTTPLPDGAYNVALMVGGPRNFYRHQRHTTKHPPFWYRLADGLRDCFAVWARRDGSPLGRDDSICAARSGRGVIYAEEFVFNNEGHAVEKHAHLIGVEFSILDKDPSKGDVLRVSRFHTIGFGDVSGDPALHLSDIELGWNRLIEAARAGFKEQCHALPQEVESWRAAFVDQRAQLRAEFDNFSDSSFRQRIDKIDWREALTLVEEAWQLQVVINRHCGNQFNSSMGRDDPTSSRVWEMLRRYECSPERLNELQQMVTDFVAPNDPIWNFAGD